MPTRNSQIRDRVTRMNNAWEQGAPTATLKGITQAAFHADIMAATNEEQVIADMEAQLKLRRVALEDKYKKLNEDSIKIREGVEGHEDFGPDHALYEAMGFVRASVRKSGLTRKKNPPPSGSAS